MQKLEGYYNIIINDDQKTFSISNTNSKQEGAVETLNRIKKILAVDNKLNFKNDDGKISEITPEIRSKLLNISDHIQDKYNKTFRSVFNYDQKEKITQLNKEIHASSPAILPTEILNIIMALSEKNKDAFHFGIVNKDTTILTQENRNNLKFEYLKNFGYQGNSSEEATNYLDKMKEDLIAEMPEDLIFNYSINLKKLFQGKNPIEKKLNLEKSIENIKNHIANESKENKNNYSNKIFKKGYKIIKYFSPFLEEKNIRIPAGALNKNDFVLKTQEIKDIISSCITNKDYHCFKYLVKTYTLYINKAKKNEFWESVKEEFLKKAEEEKEEQLIKFIKENNVNVKDKHKKSI